MRRFVLLTSILLALATPAAAQPAAQFFKGTFASNTSTGDQTISGIVDDDGNAFTPKAIILWGTGQASAAVTDGLQYMLGVTDCSGSGQIWGSAEDNAASSDTYKESNKARLIDTYDDAGAATSRATFVAASCASGEFKINWSDAPATAELYHFVAFGGSGVSAKFLALAMEGGSPGTDTSTFIAKAAFALVTGSTTADQAITTEAYNLMIGWWARQAAGTFQQGIANTCTSDADATAVTGRFQTATDYMTGITTGCAGFFQRYLFNGNYGGAVAVNANDEIPMQLFLGGDSLVTKAGAFDAPTSAGNLAVSGLGFAPKLVCLASVGTTTSASISTEARLSFGCMTPDHQGHVWIGDLQAAADMVTARKFSTTEVLSHGTPTATGSSSTFQATAARQSFDSDGFTLNFTAADATARASIWIAFGIGTSSSGGGGVF